MQIINLYKLKLWILSGLISLLVCPNIYASPDTAGIMLTDEKGKILFSQNSQKKLIPASILKILTGLASINLLGEDYQYITDYVFDDSSKDLYIKGKADPLLISEEIQKLCHDLAGKILSRHINNIVLDHSYFLPSIEIPGKGTSLNPYDAPVGALCANFNTVFFIWDNDTKQFISGEPQTPLLPIFLKRIEQTGLKEGRIVLTEKQSREYPGHLIRYFLQKEGVSCTGKILPGILEGNEGKQYTYTSSFKMKEIVRKLLQYSNNFIANQLLLTIGVRTFGEPATLDDGIEALNQFAQNDIKLKGITILEGSGLSRSNRISPEQMIKILFEFMPYYGLLKIEANDHFKTGTLSDVRTRAGYFEGHDNKLYPYVIMVNDSTKGYAAIHKRLSQMVSKVSAR